jgi:hypothetical protein
MTQNNRRHMDERGRLIGKIGKRGGGDDPGGFGLPSQAGVGGGDLFVLDIGSTRIQILDTAPLPRGP